MISAAQALGDEDPDVSDIHVNAESLRVLAEDDDELWVLGDLVNYGPSPIEVIDLSAQKHRPLSAAIPTTPSGS